MLRNLRESLAECDLATLRALAWARGMELLATRQPAAVEELAAVLCTQEATSWALSRLSPEGRAALEEMLRHGGKMKAHVFVARFGEIRALGSGRLVREKPWTEPRSAAEELCFLGLVFRAFGDVGYGYRAEFMYVPADLLPFMPQIEACPPQVKVEPIPRPAVVRSAEATLVDQVFALLVALATHRRVVRDVASAWPSEQVAFAYNLVRSLGLVRETGGRLRVNGGRTVRWLKASRERQLFLLGKAWETDRRYNELRNLPHLIFEDTGWHNDPVLARRAVLGHLRHCPIGEWLSIAQFTTQIHEVDPDFARPDGDYRSWYIRDRTTGEYLMDFCTWGRIEGELVVYLLAGPLHWLGAVDLGFDTQDAPRPAAFCITTAGGRLLGIAQSAIRAEESRPTILVYPDFTVIFPVNGRLYERFQLERIAHFKGRTPTGDFIYALTRSSLAEAYRQRISPPMIVQFLERYAAQIPTNVRSALRRFQPNNANMAES